MALDWPSFIFGLVAAVTLTIAVVWPIAYRRGIQSGRKLERYSRAGGIVTYE